MTREEAVKYLKAMKDGCNDTCHKVRYVTHEEALDMAIKALTQEPCNLLIIKSDILLHQDDRKKWMESIKREKESGVIILPPYFEPLLVPADIEINIEQEPCDEKRDCSTCKYEHNDGHTQPCRDCGTLLESYTNWEQKERELPSVTQNPGKWNTFELFQGGIKETWYECPKCKWSNALLIPRNYCPNCGECMKDGRTLDEFIEDSKESEDKE